MEACLVQYFHQSIEKYHLCEGSNQQCICKKTNSLVRLCLSEVTAQERCQNWDAKLTNGTFYQTTETTIPAVNDTHQNIIFSALSISIIALTLLILLMLGLLGIWLWLRQRDEEVDNYNSTIETRYQTLEARARCLEMIYYDHATNNIDANTLDDVYSTTANNVSSGETPYYDSESSTQSNCLDSNDTASCQSPLTFTAKPPSNVLRPIPILASKVKPRHPYLKTTSHPIRQKMSNINRNPTSPDHRRAFQPYRNPQLPSPHPISSSATSVQCDS